MIWRPHGKPQRQVLHLYRRIDSMGRVAAEPLCSSPDLLDTVTRPDGHEYCRRCIGLEGVRS